VRLLAGIVPRVTENAIGNAAAESAAAGGTGGSDAGGDATAAATATTAAGPGHTALTAAAARAAHLEVDSEPRIFADHLASVLLGSQADELIGFHRAHAAHPVLACARGQVVVRSRCTEDRLARRVAGGIGQYVILGAGLDSFACRPGLAGRVRVFEVDHPASQAWKREALARAGVRPAGAVSYVPADLETTSLTDALAAGGFDLSRPAVVSWLGVVMYLTLPAIERTLAAVGSLAAGTELIADYLLPAGLRDAAGDTYAELVQPVAAEQGEPWQTFLSPDDMAALLTRHGFSVAAQAGQQEALGPELWQRRDALRPVRLSMLARAVVTGPGRAGTPR
jgi:methyltransferase (TIGR00027 family)